MERIDGPKMLVLLIAAVIGYLAVDRNAAHAVTSWIRQEIDKEVPDLQTVSSPNYTPITPGK